MNAVRGEIDARLRELRTAVEEARSMPMSASAMINRAEFLDLIAALDAAIEQTLSQATEVVGGRDATLAAATSQAEEIVRAAELERERLVSETDVFRLAESRAAEITEAAERAAAELQAETDQYVEEKLANFELTLERTLELVRRGRAKLSGGHSHRLGDDSDVDDIVLPDHLER
ncbi:ABC-type transporter Mla subunit MlaD [Marmoricola sp. URHA0025 HA25]